MKLPPDVEFDDKLGLVMWRPQGLVNEATVNGIVQFLSELEGKGDRALNRFSDTRRADVVELNFKYVFHVSLFRRFSYPGPPIKSAILVSDSTLTHYSKMHAILTQGSPIKVRIFQDAAETAKWLGVSPEILQ